ncbi:MAG: hypothetical protein WCL38_06305 [Actinomycetota bacterium]
MSYLFAALIVFGINLLPAFGPPTWLVLVALHSQWHLNPVALVFLGAAAAAAGRFVLASSATRLRPHLPRRYQENVARAGEKLLQRRKRAITLIALFLLSPLPSAQLFIAAGLLELPLVPITLAFFAGRLVTYSLYLAAAGAATHALSQVFGDIWGSPWSVAIEVVMVLCTVALPLLPWKQRDVH